MLFWALPRGCKCQEGHGSSVWDRGYLTPLLRAPLYVYIIDPSDYDYKSFGKVAKNAITSKRLIDAIRNYEKYC